MNTFKVILATLVIFGTGVLTGAFAVRIAYTKPPFNPAVQRLPAPTNAPGLPWLPNPQFNRPEFLSRLSREVSLRPEQRARIEEMLRDSRRRTEPLVKEIGPKLRGEMQQLRGQIAQVLDPGQRKRFEELMKSAGPRRPDEPGLGNREFRRLLPRPGEPERPGNARPPSTVPPQPEPRP